MYFMSLSFLFWNHLSWAGINTRTPLQKERWIRANKMTTDDSPVWFPVFITEFLVISIINAITIIAFARICHLRKRNTYLIINLTVADLLVGAVTGPLFVCRQRKKDMLPRFIIRPIDLTFPIASQVNLSLISLERLHATLFPFRHCLITKRLYFKIIVGSWLIIFAIAFVMANLSKQAFQYAWASFSVLILVVLTVSYIIIIVNVRRSPHSQHHGSIHTERKLSVTLFIVTGVSVLTILPWAVFHSMPVDLQEELSDTSGIEIHLVLAAIYFASSIVNPLVYAIRMQEFRKAITNLVC